jgi:hypothetical protein
VGGVPDRVAHGLAPLGEDGTEKVHEERVLGDVVYRLARPGHHDRALDGRLGIEGRRRDDLFAFDVGVVARRHREPAVGRLPGSGHHAFAELPLDHDHRGPPPGQQAKDELARGPVGQVRDAGVEGGKLDLQSVSGEHVEAAVADGPRKLSFEEVGERRVALDGRHAVGDVE